MVFRVEVTYPHSSLTTANLPIVTVTIPITIVNVNIGVPVGIQKTKTTSSLGNSTEATRCSSTTRGGRSERQRTPKRQAKVKGSPRNSAGTNGGSSSSGDGSSSGESNTKINGNRRRRSKQSAFAVVLPATANLTDIRKRSNIPVPVESFVDWAQDQLEVYFSCGADSGDFEPGSNSNSGYYLTACWGGTAAAATATATAPEITAEYLRDYYFRPANADLDVVVDSKPPPSLYRKTIITAALANKGIGAGIGGIESISESSSLPSSGSSSSNTSTCEKGFENISPTMNNQDSAQAFKKAAFMARGLADDASKAIGNLLPTASLQSITTRKYTLPDKTVASQVLMYRQLLHTSCRPGLKLSRPYQATLAQKAVLHMPWWEEGIETTKKMVISYDNLISRLWLNGAIFPHQSVLAEDSGQPDLLDSNAEKDASKPVDVGLETYIGDDGLPPIPHEFWVKRLGFQQPDPVTDFRSGGVLSLALMVYMVESCPAVCNRFFSGDASVLPFGITCINVVDMIAKFLMLAKSTDRMDALLSQKPFWRMFGDPNAILALQELAMSMLADVVVELEKERKVPGLVKNENGMGDHQTGDKVTVFDFSIILERTERRVRDDLLGAGPKTVVELKSIAGRLRVKYQNNLERRIARALQQQKYRESSVGDGAGAGDSGETQSSLTPTQAKVSEVMTQAGNLAGGFLAKMKQSAQSAPAFQIPRREHDEIKPAATTPATISADLSAVHMEPTIVTLPAAAAPAATTSATKDDSYEDEGEWAGTDLAPATDAISNFSIGDDDDEDLL